MGTHPLIYFRTDGNSQIASGHLVRCLAIAGECAARGASVCFLVSDGESAELLLSFFDKEASFPVKILKTAAYDNLERELPELTALLQKRHGYKNDNTVFFLDSYFVTKAYLEALGSLTKTVYLDDLRLFDYPVDLVINYDVILKESLPDYEGAYLLAGKKLLGASYTPLRKQFLGHSPLIREEVKNILLTSGGSDPFHTCLHLAKELLQAGLLEDTKLHIAMGKLNRDKDLLNRLAEDHACIHIHENKKDMAALMKSCDLAVSAAGTMLYELCAMGIPTAGYVLADNQLMAAEAFDKAGAVPCMGDVRKEEGDVFHKVCEWVEERKKDLRARKESSQRMHSLVDGNGSRRIAAGIMEIAAGEKSFENNS